MEERGATSAAYDEFWSRPTFGSLDGLRAIAVAGTVWHHMAGFHQDGTRPGIENSGWMGVHLFFAISGFLITTLLLREWVRSGRIDVAAFWRRRVARIFPAFYLTLVGYLVLTPLLRPELWDRLVAALPWLATYTANFGVDPGGAPVPFNHAWTLGVEEQFYLLWPLVLAAALRFGGLRAGVATAGLVVGVLVLVLPGAAASIDGVVGMGLSTFAISLGGGALLAVVLRTTAGFRRVNRVLGARYAALAAVTLFVALVETGGSWFLVSTSLVLVVGTCALTEQHALAPVLTWKPAARLGQVSYGVYLFHALVAWCLVAAGMTRDRPLFALATLAATTLIATASYRWFEQPMRRRINGITRRPAAADRAPEASPSRT